MTKAASATSPKHQRLKKRSYGEQGDVWRLLRDLEAEEMLILELHCQNEDQARKFAGR